jgi:Aerotolerance regulator N-terminal/von Willebrand factor type A domain
MTFLAPWLLAALPAIGVPVLIHLLNRGKPRPIRWAAMQFLLDSVRKNQRRLQLRDLILLILRVLVVLFLVLLFAQPAIWAPAGSTGLVPAPVSGMMVLDVSASMGQSDGRRTRLELARDQALKMLDEFSSDSLCGLILATDRVVPVVPRPSNNLELVRDNLSAVTGTSSATDLLPALDRAFQELARSPGAQKMVFLYTDSQESAWRERPAIRALAKKYPGIALRSIPIGKAGEPNTAITGISIQPSNPTAGKSAKVRIDVSNLTDKALDGLRVTLAANRDRPQDEATLPSIPAGKSASANLKITFDSPGLQTLSAEIPQDLFPTDNVRSLAVRVGEPRKFLILAESRPGDRRTTPAYFLRTALGATQKGAEVRVLTVDQLTTVDAEAASAIFVCSPTAVGDAQWAILEKFVRAGGGVVVFPEGQASSALGATPATQWLPGTIGQRLPQPATWVQSGLQHPVTAAWSDANRTRLTNISADIRFGLTPRQGAVTLVKYSDGVPVAVSSDLGSGRMVLFGTSPVPISTKLVLHPFFPILVGGLVDYLAIEQATTSTLRPGDSFSSSVPPGLIGKKVYLASDRAEGRIEVGVVAAAETEGRIKISAIDNPGGYRVFVEGSDEAVAAFSVALDPTESVLTAAEPVEMEAVKGEAKEAQPAVAAGAKVPREVWIVFATLLIFLCIAELILAHRFTMAR